MSESVHDLIGRIIDPRPAYPRAVQRSVPAVPREPVSVLIGGILDPEWARVGRPLVAEPAPPAGEGTLPAPEIPAV